MFITVDSLKLIAHCSLTKKDILKDFINQTHFNAYSCYPVLTTVFTKTCYHSSTRPAFGLLLSPHGHLWEQSAPQSVLCFLFANWCRLIADLIPSDSFVRHCSYVSICPCYSFIWWPVTSRWVLAHVDYFSRVCYMFHVCEPKIRSHPGRLKALFRFIWPQLACLEERKKES